MISEDCMKLFVSSNVDSLTSILIYYYLRLNRYKVYLVPLHPIEAEMLNLNMLPALMIGSNFETKLLKISEVLCMKSGLSDLIMNSNEISDFIIKKMNLNGNDLISSLNSEINSKKFLIFDHITIADLFFFLRVISKILLMQFSEISGLVNLKNWIFNMLKLPNIKNILEDINPEFLKIEEYFEKNSIKTIVEEPNSKLGKVEKKQKPVKSKLSIEIGDVSSLDIRVGKANSIEAYPDFNFRYYIVIVDIGNKEMRRIAISAHSSITGDNILTSLLCVCCNIKEQLVGKYLCHGLVLYVQDKNFDIFQLLQAPQESTIGEPIVFKGFERNPIPDIQIDTKNNLWETISSEFKTNNQYMATYRNEPWMTSKGPISCNSISHGIIIGY